MKLFALLSTIAILIAGCSNTTGPGVTSGTIQNGTLMGVVKIGDELNGSSPRDSSNSSGVLVQLDQTGLSTVTDSSGYWSISNVPAGNYDITISKPDFGLMRAYGVTVAGPGNAYLPSMRLGLVPKLAPTLDSIRNTAVVSRLTDQIWDTTQMVQIHWTAPLAYQYAGLAIFIDGNPNVQPGDVHRYSSLNGNNWLGWGNGWRNDTTAGAMDNKGVFNYPLAWLYAAGFKSGETLYVSIAQYDPYPINGQDPYNSASYYDPVHNQRRLISPSPKSNTVMFTVP